MFLHINNDLRKFIVTSSKANKRKPVKNMQPSEVNLGLRQNLKELEVSPLLTLASHPPCPNSAQRSS